MADFPLVPVQSFGAPLLISPATSTGLDPFANRTGIGVSAVWPVANLALFTPFRIERPFRVQKFLITAPVTSGNIDMGVYNTGGGRLVSSGSTALTANPQSITTNCPFVLLPGVYYLACAVDNTTAAFPANTVQTAADYRVTGCVQQAAAFPLPAVATFATYTQAYGLWLNGLFGRSLV